MADSILEILLRFSGDSKEAVDAVEKLSKKQKAAAEAQKKAAEEQKKKIDDVRNAWSKASGQLTNLIKDAARASALIGGALVGIAKSAANYGDEILTASEKTGESVENLSRLKYAAEIGETSLDGLTNGLALLSRKMVDAVKGNAEYQATFDSLGIKIRNADGSMRSATDVLLDFADYAANAKDKTLLTANAIELFGRSGADLLPLLGKGKQGITDLMNEADHLGLTIDEVSAKAGDEFNDNLTALTGSLTGVRTAIGNYLLPVLSEYVKKITDWIVVNRKVIAQKITDFFKAFISVAKAVVWVVEQLSRSWYVLLTYFAAFKIAKLIIAFAELKKALQALPAAISKNIGQFAKFGAAATLAATAAIIAINAAFDALNARLDAIAGKEQRIYSDVQKSQELQRKVQNAYIDEQKKKYKELGDSEIEANAKALADWQKKQKEIGIESAAMVTDGYRQSFLDLKIKEYSQAGLSAIEAMQKAQQDWTKKQAEMNRSQTTSAKDTLAKFEKYSATHKDKLSADINAVLKAEKEAGKEGLDDFKGVAVQKEDIAAGLAQEIKNLESETLKASADNEKLSLAERIAAADAWLAKQKEILSDQYSEEKKKLEESGEANKTSLNLLNEKYRLFNEQRKAEHQETLGKINEDEKKAAEERIKTAEDEVKRKADLERSLKESQIDLYQDMVDNENASKEERLQAAKDLYSAKVELILAEIAWQKERELLAAKDDVDRAKIEEKFKNITLTRLGQVRKAYEDTFASLNEDIYLFGINLTELVNTITDGMTHIQTALGGLDKLLGTETGGIQDALGSAVSGFQSGASAIGSFIYGDIVGGIASAISALSSFADMFDALSESTQEGYVKQFERQGFDDTYSEELLNKMSEVSDAMGDKSYGIMAYLEDFFAETDISNEEEFSYLSDLLNQKMGEDIAQGKTVEEVYEQYGDELQQLLDAQEQYGFETTDSLAQMLKLQKQQTSAGRVSGLTDVVSNLESVIEGMSGYDFSQESWNSVFGMFQDTFKKLQSEGLSMAEIQEIIGPTMEKALKIAEEQGLDISSIEQLKSFYKKMTGASGLLDVISGLQSAVTGLSETGTLTQENISQSSTAALETYQKLLDEGFSQNEALMQMGSLLGEISDSAEQYGYAIPEELQKLITAAEGINAIETEKPLDETISDGLVEGFDRVVEVMKSYFGDLPAYARGGIVRSAEGEETYATVHGGEYVINQDAVRSVGTNILDAVNNNGIMPTTYVPVISTDTQAISQQVEQLQKNLESQQAVFASAITGEIANSIRDGIAAAMPNAGRTEISTNVSLSGNSLIKFIETAMANGSLKINANAIKVS